MEKKYILVLSREEYDQFRSSCASFNAFVDVYEEDKGFLFSDKLLAFLKKEVHNIGIIRKKIIEIQ